MATDPALDLESFAARLPAGAPVFGLDLGTKTIGIAISDLSRTIATAFHTIRRRKFSADAAELIDLAGRNAIAGLVIGLPLNLDGTEGPRVQSTRAFVRNLSALTPLPVTYWDERLSTQAVERMMIAADTSRRRRAEVVDELAAAYLLQAALDRLRNL
ncbi:MAG: Holliday junction resolvase RuvX [Hyphomicrobiaceae bacterium]